MIRHQQLQDFMHQVYALAQHTDENTTLVLDMLADCLEAHDARMQVLMQPAPVARAAALRPPAPLSQGIPPSDVFAQLHEKRDTPPATSTPQTFELVSRLIDSAKVADVPEFCLVHNLDAAVFQAERSQLISGGCDAYIQRLAALVCLDCVPIISKQIDGLLFEHTTLGTVEEFAEFS